MIEVTSAASACPLTRLRIMSGSCPALTSRVYIRKRFMNLLAVPQSIVIQLNQQTGLRQKHHRRLSVSSISLPFSNLITQQYSRKELSANDEKKSVPTIPHLSVFDAAGAAFNHCGLLSDRHQPLESAKPGPG